MIGRATEIRTYGLVLEDESAQRQTVTRVEVTEQLDSDDAYDLVIVLVRKNQLAAVVPVIAQSRQTPNVLFMVNNAAGVADLVTAVGCERGCSAFRARAAHVTGMLFAIISYQA